MAMSLRIGRCVRLLGRWQRLSLIERKACLRAAYLMLYYRLSLFRVPFRTLYETVSKRDAIASAQTTVAVIPESRLVRIIDYARKLVPRTTCLSAAFAAKVFLVEHGLNPVLRIGVKKPEAGELEAHAWLTIDERIITGRLADLSEYYQILPAPTRSAGEE